jgi:hypothetical protein
LKTPFWETLKRALEESVEINSEGTIDDWNGNTTAQPGRWPNVAENAQRANFEALQWHIFHLKNLDCGIHHHISRDHIGSCHNEFNVRFNN